MADAVLAWAWVPPGAGKKGCLPSNTYTRLTRSQGHWDIGWDEGMGAQLKWELEARVGGGRRGESVYCGGKRWGAGLPGAAGQAAARRLPARGYAR